MQNILGVGGKGGKGQRKEEAVCIWYNAVLLSEGIKFKLL
jgi:hypothetical protein